MSSAVASAREVEGVRIIRDTREALHALEKDTEIALDLETSGLRPHADKIAVVSMYGDESSTLGVLHVRGHIPAELKRFLEQPHRRLTTHNGVGFDLPYLLHAGVEVTAPKLYDTLVGGTVLAPNSRRDYRVSLKAEVDRRLGVTLAKDADHTSWMNPVLTEQQVQYCAEDIVHIHALRRSQEQKARETGQVKILDLESQLVGTTARMTHRGFPISLEELHGFLEEEAVISAELGGELSEALGAINWGSHVQVKEVFQRVAGITLPTTEADFLKEVISNGPEGLLDGDRYDFKLMRDFSVPFRKSIDLLGPGMFLSEENLILLRSEDIKQAERAIEYLTKLVRLKQANKRQQSYGPKFEAQHVWEGIVHARFWQCGADTGRYTSSDPNLQQVPVNMRHVFGHRPGFSMVSVDYSQIEVVGAAYLANDKVLLKLIESGGDVHTMVAEALFGLKPGTITDKKDRRRRLSKACSFTLLFGGGAKRLVQQARVEQAPITLAEGKELVELFFNRFKGLAQERRDAYQTARAGHRAIKLNIASGLKRTLVGGDIRPTKILNTLVQGAAAGGLKHGLLVATKRGLAPWLCGTVHDEVVGWVESEWAEEYGRELSSAMIEGMQKIFPVPIQTEIKVGTQWS